jgi:hypothetical protein
MTALYEQHPDGLRSSFFFKNHLKGVAPFCNRFIRRVIGDGRGIIFWEDNWEEEIMKRRFNILYTFAREKEASLRTVLYTDDLSALFRPVLSEQAQTEMNSFVEVVAQTRLVMSNGQLDDAIWKGHASGSFTVKSAYFTLKNGDIQHNLKLKSLWKLSVPPRFKIFGWLLLLNRILTIENLNKRGFSFVSICQLCRLNEETTKHLFRDCHFSKQLYFRMFNGSFHQLGYQVTTTIDFEIFLLDKRRTKQLRELLLIAIFVLWRERCTRTFREKSKTIEELLEEIEIQWDWMNKRYIS